MQKHRFNVRLGSLLWSVERGKSWSGSDGEGERHGGKTAFCAVTVLAMQVSCKICSQMGSVSLGHSGGLLSKRPLGFPVVFVHQCGVHNVILH